jgi:hypothetical protein
MARYRELLIQGEKGWYLMNPRNPWEALKVAWYLWRYPDKVGALVCVSQEFVITKCNRDNSNEK